MKLQYKTQRQVPKRSSNTNIQARLAQHNKDVKKEERESLSIYIQNEAHRLRIPKSAIKKIPRNWRCPDKRMNFGEQGFLEFRFRRALITLCDAPIIPLFGSLLHSQPNSFLGNSNRQNARKADMLINRIQAVHPVL